MDRKKDKIKEIENYLEELESVIPSSFKQYETDFKIRAIFERYFEKIVESAIDLAMIIIKERGLKIPKIEKESLDILLQEKIISLEVCNFLKDAKGMRNIIAHEYGEIDNELVFDSVKNLLMPSVNKFLECVK